MLTLIIKPWPTRNEAVCIADATSATAPPAIGAHIIASISSVPAMMIAASTARSGAKVA